MFIMQQSQLLEGQSVSAFAPGMPEAVIDLGEFTIQSMPLGLMPAQFDITMMVADMNEGLGASLHYNSDLFNVATMSRMLDAFQTILHSIVADPGQEIRALPLLPDDQRDKLIKGWINTTIDFPSDLCLQQLFEIQVKSNPDKIAITFEDQSLTYRELDD
jgi:non-ribosomal peptide synthetase component F